MSSDDALKDIDLSAWDVPEPPDDLADSVVARLGGTDITPAIPVEAPKRSRALLIGGVAAAVVALTLGVWTLIGSTDRAAPKSGVVVAQFAQQLSLNGVTADLDVGADVQWTRDARTMHVQQRSGNAAWRVAADQRLVINAGGSTVEASGKSSLRVEVKMNSVERVVGASAFGAAAIAMTVIVYDGKVVVENPQHERVVVAPGTTYTVEPPAEEETVGVAPVTVPACNLDTCILENYAGPCCEQYKPTPTLTTEQINETMTALHDQIEACGQSYPAAGRVDVRVKVKDDGSVANVVIANTPDAALGECVSQVISAAQFHPSQEAMTVFTFPLIFPTPVPPPPPTTTCDGKAEREQGDDAMAQGKHAEALVHYEAAAKCVADPTYVRLAFVAACNAKNQEKAKLYFRRLSQGERDKYRVVCIRNSVDVDDAKPVCDADALKEEAIDLMGQGMHAGALAKFEAALACRETPQLESLAFAAACNAKNEDRAKAHYAKLSTSEQERMKQICIRNKVAIDDGGCDAAALKAKGLENVDFGQHAVALAQFEASLRCKVDNDVLLLAAIAACNANNTAKAKLYTSKLPANMQAKANCQATTCDADALKDKGMENVNEAHYAAALALFEASLRCKQDGYVLSLAFIAACNAQNAPKAKLYFAQLTPAQQAKYKQMCIRNRIDPEGGCDADALKAKGLENEKMGQYAAALAQYEASLSCKRDPDVIALAGQAACKAQNKAKAKQYSATCDACDADALKAKGLENEKMGQYAAALAQYEASLRCKQDADVTFLAGKAACKANNAAKAKQYKVTCNACDADALKAKGLENEKMGQYAAALAQYEASLRCQQDPDVLALAGQAACKAKNTAKAKQYNATCACDATALKDQGLDLVNKAQHAKALEVFEQSLACKADAYVTQLAYMEACNSKNAAKAKSYFAQLTTAQQAKFEQLCVRNGIKVSSCDADALKDQGMEQVNMGEHAKALALFEQSLSCKSDTYVVALAFMAACNTQDTAKARSYYGRLNPTQKSKYRMMCDRNGVDLDACDADALKDKGMENINQGKHTEALALFEQSLACKADPYVVQLAFMESCNSRNGTKARQYWGQLSKAEQTKYQVICDRNKIDIFNTSGDPKGYLQVFSKPSAKILIDGVDTGMKTPIVGTALALTPGKHKVTFVIGGDRFTYFVTTKSGQTDTMTKDLQ